MRTAIWMALSLGAAALATTGCGGSTSSDASSGGASGSTSSSGGTGGQGGGAVVANCGSGDCAIEGGQVCCFNPNTMAPDPELQCTAGGACELTVGCDGPEDCASGEVCCHTGATVACSASCSGDVFCHTANDCPDPAIYDCVEVVGGFVSACMAPQ